MHFRPATIADIPVLRDLGQRIWRACYLSIISREQIEFMLEWMYSEEQIAAEMERGVTWEVIEREGETAAGFLSFHLENDGRVKLNKLYVLPELQGGGVGTRALEHVMRRARELGGRAVWMQVNKRNHRAVGVYQKAGFRIAQEAVFDIGHGFIMDDYLMEKEVPPCSASS
jgi:diamine N-acetyltransferase